MAAPGRAAAQRLQEAADIAQAQRHQRRGMAHGVARGKVVQQLLTYGLRQIALLGRLHGKSQLTLNDYSIHILGAVRHARACNALLRGMQRK